MYIPQTVALSDAQKNLFAALLKSCQSSILRMTAEAESGHPGGSLSSLHYLLMLYAFRISQTGEPVVISNGHVSPAVYSVLAELGYIDREEVVKGFRKIETIFEGHVTRHVPGVLYGTGPLGIGVSVAAGMALAEKLKGTAQKVYATMGDGEAQEGQVHEMMLFAKKHALSNLILFVDANKVQLSDSIEHIMPIALGEMFTAGGWRVLEADAHNVEELWKILGEAHTEKERPVVIIGHSIMGYGVPFMEEEGRKWKSTWHGSAPKKAQIEEFVKEQSWTQEEALMVEAWKKEILWTPEDPHFEEWGSVVKLDIGTPTVRPSGTVTDCRGAYGEALLDLAKRNSHVVAMTADLAGSVKTDGVAKAIPERHIECGICEQNMVSVAGGLSLRGMLPFASTFAAFMSSRAKDQARVNDISRTNVKMVATHAGLSVGEDGPTHQAIDDSGSFVGLLHTGVLEPADPNQCDHMVRFIAGHYGNYYMRMGRHKFAVLTKEDGTPYYDGNYQYTYGKTDRIRTGSHLTIAATGALVGEAVKAWESLKAEGIEVEVIAVSSIKHYDEVLLDSIRKTGRVLTLEDHNTYSGLGAQLARTLLEKGIQVKSYHMSGVDEYQLSGKGEELYHKMGLDTAGIIQKVKSLG